MRLNPRDQILSGPKMFSKRDDALAEIMKLNLNHLVYDIEPVPGGFLPVFRCPTWELVRYVRAKGFLALISKIPEPENEVTIRIKR